MEDEVEAVEEVLVVDAGRLEQRGDDSQGLGVRSLRGGEDAEVGDAAGLEVVQLSQEAGPFSARASTGQVHRLPLVRSDEAVGIAGGQHRDQPRRAARSGPMPPPAMWIAHVS